VLGVANAMSTAVTGSTHRFLGGSADAILEPGEFVMGIGFEALGSLSPA
jgi:hypothetical protein